LATASEKAALVDITYPDYDKWLAADNPASLSVGPIFQPATGREVPDIQDITLSDTTFAFDVPLAGRIVRMAIGSSTYAISPATGYPALLADFVMNDGVFGQSIHGTSGYGEEWRIDTDGAPVVERAKAGRHISTFVTDGSTLFWTETIGSTDIFAIMREV
jgi:hypothetical protein